MNPAGRATVRTVLLCGLLAAASSCKTNDVLLGSAGSLDAVDSGASADAGHPPRVSDAALDVDASGPTGSASDASTSDASGTTSACGARSCRSGLVCCSASCGLCSEKDSCNPIECEPEPSPCTAADCGPTLGVPMQQLCMDGSQAGQTCARDSGGKCVWVELQCPVRVEAAVRCVSSDPAACSAGHYCNLAGSAGCVTPEQGGVCAAVPAQCGAEHAAVCGCDGRTYQNACVAASQGSGVDHDGPC